MIDLESELRVWAERLPVERGEPVVRAVSHRRRRHRRRRMAVVGSTTALAVVLVAGLVTAWPDSTAEDDGIHVTTGPTQPTRVPGWHELDAGPMTGRAPALTVWADDQLVVFAQDELLDGADWADVSAGVSYSPDGGGWRRLPAGPDAEVFPTSAVWTGSEVILTGRTPAGARSGFAYSPATDQWRRLQVSDPPSDFDGVGYYGEQAWRDMRAVWTGSQVVFPLAATAYDVEADRWEELPAVPGAELVNAEVAWTGEEVVVIGRDTPYSQLAGPAVGAAYDPAAGRWRSLPPSGLASQAVSIAWNGSEVVAVNYDMTAAAYDPRGDRWRDLPRLPLRRYECSPRVIALGATTVADMCAGLALAEADVDVWWPVEVKASLVAADARAFGFGPPSDPADPASDRHFYEFVPSVTDDGTITPPRRLVVGLEVLVVPDDANGFGHASEEQMGGLVDQVRLQFAWQGERCVLQSTYAGTGAPALIEGYRTLDGAREITVAPLDGGPRRPALLLPAGARLPEDDRPHLVFELDDAGGSDVMDITCETATTTRAVAAHLSAR